VAELRVFLDTSALFAGVFSPSGGARAILRLAEMDAVSLWVGPSVLREAEEVFRRKAPDLLPLLATLLHQAHVCVAPEPRPEHAKLALEVVEYEPDQRVIAEALSAEVSYLATHDQVHLLHNPRVEKLPCLVGTPGDCLAWLRQAIRPAE
jgi:predicted nucleic acid-binding protein